MEQDPPFMAEAVILSDGKQNFLAFPLKELDFPLVSGEKGLVNRLANVLKKYADQFMTAFAETLGQLLAFSCYSKAIGMV